MELRRLVAGDLRIQGLEAVGAMEMAVVGNCRESETMVLAVVPSIEYLVGEVEEVVCKEEEAAMAMCKQGEGENE